MENDEACEVLVSRFRDATTATSQGLKEQIAFGRQIVLETSDFAETAATSKSSACSDLLSVRTVFADFMLDKEMARPLSTIDPRAMDEQMSSSESPEI